MQDKKTMILHLFCNNITLTYSMIDVLNVNFNFYFQADIHELDKGYAYVSFGIVLFVWEFLPTFIIVIFFRVRKPPTSTIVSLLLNRTFHISHSNVLQK